MQRNRKIHRERYSAAPAVVASLLVVFAIAPNLSALRNRGAPLHDMFSGRALEQVSANATIHAGDSAWAAQVSFRPGEILNYRLGWAVFANAAAAQLAVVEKRDFFGMPTWHFRASAHTQGPLRSLAEIDDQFDSYADIGTLESRQYETYLDELGEKQNTVSRLVSTGSAKKNQTPAVLVKPGTRDPLGALYFLRTIDWQRTPEFEAPVYDGEDLYEMRVRVDGPTEVISVAGRAVSTTKISIHLFRGGRQSRTECSIWFSQDDARIPVLIQAEVPYGMVRAELTSQTR